MNCDEPLLTICIPTYNRGKRVYSLVLYLLEHVISRHRSCIELLIVNNCSTDNTISYLHPLIEQGVRLINREVHLPSAEANMFASVEFCRGRYVWFHGDDDIPIPGNIESLLSHLHSDEVDLFVTNSITIDAFGKKISDRIFKINNEFVDFTGGKVVCACGFIAGFAGISGVVFRKSMADISVANNISKIQEIYAHVAWLIHCFSQAKIRVLSQPLVYYRVDEEVNTFNHFVKYAKRIGVGNYYVWSFGLIKLLNYLLDSGDLSARDISMIYDVRRNGTRFRLVDQIIYSIFLQIKDSVKDRDPRSFVSQEDIRFATDFFYKIDIFSFDTLTILEEIVSIHSRKSSVYKLSVSSRTAKLFRQFQNTFNAQISDNFYRPVTVELVKGYRIYETPVGYVAISDSVHTRIESILCYIDPVDDYPDIITSQSIYDLRNKIIYKMDSSEPDDNLNDLTIYKSFEKVLLSLRSINNSIISISKVGNELADMKAHENEIYRQSTFALRLLTFKLFFNAKRFVIKVSRIYSRFIRS